MTGKKTRSAVWAMINWGIVQDAIEEQTTLIPDQESIEMAIESIEHDYSEADLFKFEAEELEQHLIDHIIEILKANHGKDIKRRITQRDREQKLRENEQQDAKVGISVLPFGNMKDLKDMNLDPDMMEALTKSMFDNLFGSKKKPKKDKDEDEDEDDDPGSSFYT